MDRTYEIKVSFLEIYNENIRDLFESNSDPEAPEQTFLDLREDPEKGVIVSGLSEVVVNSAEEIMNLLIHGN